MKIVLASQSPRRRELMQQLGLDFEICPAKGEEETDENLSIESYVCSLAKKKALEVSAKYDGDTLTVAADTIVCADGKVLGKPKDKQDAAAMLRMLSGRTHEVFTGLCLAVRGELLCHAEKTEVRFRILSEDEIAAYIATGEPMDKAGAYGIQGKAAVFVEGINGDYYNVMGLPLCRLNEMMKEARCVCGED